MRAKQVTVMAMCVALAMILSYVESMTPPPVPSVPGVKLGLANLAVIFALYRLGWKESIGISLLRVFLVSLLFGHVMSLAYSASGAALSIIGMILLKRTDKLSCVAVSVTGGVLHNIGQILVAWAIMGRYVLYYLPALILGGTAAGVAIGVVSAILVKRVKI